MPPVYLPFLGDDSSPNPDELPTDSSRRRIRQDIKSNCENEVKSFGGNDVEQLEGSSDVYERQCEEQRRRISENEGDIEAAGNTDRGVYE